MYGLSRTITVDKFNEETLTVTVLYVVVSELTQLFGLTVCENLSPVELRIRAGVTCGRRAHFGNSRVHNIATVTTSKLKTLLTSPRRASRGVKGSEHLKSFYTFVPYGPRRVHVSSPFFLTYF